MKIAAYTIALNESAHCERWAESVKDADYRIVLDTGSDDGTVERLRELGVTVYQQQITPWRFDVARNAALALVPDDADACISLDMDEFMEAGWRPRLEAAWGGKVTRLSYTYVFDHKPGAETQRGFHADKIHARHGYEWRRPVHETVFPTPDIVEVYGSDPQLVMNQIQDRSKPTRVKYLNLMEIAHREDPNDSQIAFWYGRELMYAGQNPEAAEVLERYLDLPTSTWKGERSEAMIYLSWVDAANKDRHLMHAAAEAPHRREVWFEMVKHYYAKQDWINLLWAAQNGLALGKREGSYLDREEAWNTQIPDLGSIAAWNLGWKDKARELCDMALAMDPQNERIINNRRFMD